MGSFPCLVFKPLKNYIRKFSAMASSPLDKVIQHLNSFADISMAEPWDNVGLLVEPSQEATVKKILLTNDLTETVLEQAVIDNVQLIISYHPPIFAPLKRLTQKSWKERIITKCIENKIAVYSPHTAWDNKDHGVNDWLISRFWPHHFSTRTPLQKREDVNVQDYFGGGRLITDGCIELKQAVTILKELTNINALQIAWGKKQPGDEIRSIAAVPGSGSSLLKGISADLYITGEMSHHDILDAVHNGTTVVLTNHSNSERGYLDVFKKYLEDTTGITCVLANNDKDPLSVE